MDYVGLLEESGVAIDMDDFTFGEKSQEEQIVIQVLNVVGFAFCILINATSQYFMPWSNLEIS